MKRCIERLYATSHLLNAEPASTPTTAASPGA